MRQNLLYKSLHVLLTRSHPFVNKNRNKGTNG